jgi:hypothetical protein
MFNGEMLRGVASKVKKQSEGGRRPCDKVCVACAELCVEVAERDRAGVSLRRPRRRRSGLQNLFPEVALIPTSLPVK